MTLILLHELPPRPLRRAAAPIPFMHVITLGPVGTKLDWSRWDAYCRSVLGENCNPRGKHSADDWRRLGYPFAADML